MIAHTPGPWTFRIALSETPCCGAVISSIGYVSADTGHQEIAVLYSHDQQDANARLIAAAPELLDALKNIIRRHEWVPGLGPCICPEHVAARAAIAKAEGR